MYDVYTFDVFKVFIFLQNVIYFTTYCREPKNKNITYNFRLFKGEKKFNTLVRSETA